MSAEVRALLAALAALEAALQPQETGMDMWREAEAYARFQGEGRDDDHPTDCVCPACIQDALDDEAQQDLFDEEEDPCDADC